MSSSLLGASARKASGVSYNGASRAVAELPLRQLSWVQRQLTTMKVQKIWPNGLRYLWTDSFGLILLLTLYQETQDDQYLQEARWVVKQVNNVLGLPSGAIRIGQAIDRHGVYFHYLSMWWFALSRMSEVTGEAIFREEGIAQVKICHPKFFTKTGVWWKLKEDLSGPEPGYGKGAMDHYDGYFAYKMLDPDRRALGSEVDDMKYLVDKRLDRDFVDQDLGLGMMLWMASFFPNEHWAQAQRQRCIQTLDGMWVEAKESGTRKASETPQQTDQSGYFARRVVHN